MWTTMLGTILAGAAFEGSPLTNLIEPNAALVTFGPLLAYLAFRLGPTKTWLLFRRLLRNAPLPKDEYTLDRLVTLGFLTSTICGVIGIIHVMTHLSDTATLGAGMAVAFVGVLYGTLPALLVATVKRPNPAAPSAKVLPLKQKAAGYLAASIFILLFSAMTVLFALANVPPSFFPS